jgi:carbon monoxide dehydrogenase subunit G
MTAMRFEGDRDFPLPPTEVFTKLRDARFLVQCVPDSSPQGEPTQDKAQCTVRPGFAFVRGTIELTMEVAEAVAPTKLRLMLLSKGIGTSSDVEAVANFAAKDNGTALHWTAEVKRLGGLLKAVPSGLIRGAAQKVIEDLWNGVAARLAEKN